MTDEQPAPATGLERAVHELLRDAYQTVTLGRDAWDTYAFVPVAALDALRRAVDPDRPAPRPFVAFDPAMQGGRATIGGTGLTVELMAERIFSGWSETGILSDWDYLTRADLITACWFVGTYGSRTWRRRWGAWAAEAHGPLWRCDAAEIAAIPWPPCVKGAR